MCFLCKGKYKIHRQVCRKSREAMPFRKDKNGMAASDAGDLRQKFLFQGLCVCSCPWTAILPLAMCPLGPELQIACSFAQNGQMLENSTCQSFTNQQSRATHKGR